MANPTILVNLDRCVGCWSCSMACKIGNNLADDTWFSTVRTLGNGMGIDHPSGTWPKLHMSWIPVYSKSCMMCAGRTKKGLEPYCSDCCPTLAMTYGDLDDASSEISKKVADFTDKGYKLFRLPAWENSKDSIVYASKR